MGLFDLEYFKLEKKKDECYRCKGGHLADIILLSSGIIYCFVMWIFSPIISLFKYACLNKEQKDYLKARKKYFNNK